MSDGSASSNGARTIENSVNHTGSFTVGGSNAVTLAGTYTHSGGNRTLTNSNGGGLTMSGPVFLANDNATARTLTIAGNGSTEISGNIANNNAENTTASGLTKNGDGTLTLSGSGSTRENVQRLGRLLRKHGDKQAVLYELVARGTAEEFVSDRRRQHQAFGNG